MISIAPPNGNGSHLHQSIWRQRTVQQFFTSVNWEDHSPEIQELRQSSSNGHRSLSLDLKVSQFFNAIDWEGSTIATVPHYQESAAAQGSGADAFTLEDFSDLF
ncbi:MAG: hypothetical protein Kow00121_22700 [Elainellaceae cyanobacterium]